MCAACLCGLLTDCDCEEEENGDTEAFLQSFRTNDLSEMRQI